MKYNLSLDFPPPLKRYDLVQRKITEGKKDLGYSLYKRSDEIMRVIPSGFIICFSAATKITGATLSGKAQHIHGCKAHNCLGGFFGRKKKDLGWLQAASPSLSMAAKRVATSSLAFGCYFNNIFFRMVILPLMFLIRAELTWLFPGSPTLFSAKQVDLGHKWIFFGIRFLQHFLHSFCSTVGWFQLWQVSFPISVPPTHFTSLPLLLLLLPFLCYRYQINCLIQVSPLRYLMGAKHTSPELALTDLLLVHRNYTWTHVKYFSK